MVENKNIIMYNRFIDLFLRGFFKMKTVSKFFAVFLCVVLLLSVCCSCKGSSNAVVYCEVDNPPTIIDPQLAQSESELMMVRNLFEGLFRYNENGEIVNGVIEDYTYYDKVYTFNISPSACWSDGSNITADDFVFAFTRAVDPATKSPFAAKFSTILNADIIATGAVSAENLGVKAKDSSTFVVVMDKEDPDFLDKLTSAPFMPCNREFFKSCKGEYGLKKDKILTNGSYKLSKWTKEDFAARLYRNEMYYGEFTAKNTAIFLSNNTEKNNLDMLTKSSVDIAHISPNDTVAANSAGLVTNQEDNIVWVIKFPASFSENLRKAFILSIDKNLYSGNLGIGYTAAHSYFPTCVTKLQLNGVGFDGYDIYAAKNLFSNAIKELPGKRLPSTTLYYYNDPSFLTPINNIVGHWQNNLGAYINIKPVTLSEAKNAASSYVNAISVYPIEITDKDAAPYIKELGYENVTFGEKDLAEIQTAVYSNYLIVPLAFQNSVIAYSKNLSSVVTDLGNGTIDFSFVRKK